MPTSKPRSKPNPRIRMARRLVLKSALLWIAAALAVILVAAAVSVYQAYTSEIIWWGVDSLGVDIAGLTRSQAATVLQQSWYSRQIEIWAANTSVIRTPPELGLVLDAESTAESAYVQGRQFDALADVMAIIRGDPRVTVTPVWEINRAVSDAHLRSLALQLDRQPVDASLEYAGGEIQALASQPGIRLDVTGSLRQLVLDAGDILNSGVWQLDIEQLDPAVPDLSDSAREANQWLAQTLSFDVYDPITDEQLQFELPSGVWSQWVAVSVETGDDPTITWELDPEKTEAGLQEQMSQLGASRTLNLEELTVAIAQAAAGEEISPLRAYHQAITYTVKPGDMLATIAVDWGIPYPWIQQANEGVGDSIYADQVITIPSPDVLVPLPVIPSKRITISLESQMLYAYEDGALKWEWPVSSGLPSSPTAVGVFQVQKHEENAFAAIWDLYMPKFLAIYEPIPGTDFFNGIHGFPWRGERQLLWVNQLGQPATFGCIMLSTENAELLYDWAEDGTIVHIRL